MTKQHRGSKSTGQGSEQPPDAELDVLACICRRRRATARQIREDLYSYRPMAHGSVVTLLKRLETRGLVSRSKGSVGKAFVYCPTRSTRPTYRRIIRNVVERVFGGNSLEMVSTLFDTKLPTQDELERLQEMLDQLQIKRKKRRRKS